MVKKVRRHTSEEQKKHDAVMQPQEAGAQEVAQDAGNQENLANMESQLKRALADYQNLQRRVVEEREAIGKFATQMLLLELLPIFENLGQIIEHAPEQERKSSWFEALQISIRQINEVLNKEGIEEINPIDSEFNPHEHEAIELVEGPEENRVIGVLQKGYKLHGKIIRAAKVKVSKKAQ